MTAEFLERDSVLFLHDLAVSQYGGIPGVKHDGLLMSALARPENKLAYAETGAVDLFDLAAAYARGCRPAAPVNWSFADYLAQQAHRQAVDIARAAQYWQERLATLPSAPGLPLQAKPAIRPGPRSTRCGRKSGSTAARPDQLYSSGGISGKPSFPAMRR